MQKSFHNTEVMKILKCNIWKNYEDNKDNSQKKLNKTKRMIVLWLEYTDDDKQ